MSNIQNSYYAKAVYKKYIRELEVDEVKARNAAIYALYSNGFRSDEIRKYLNLYNVKIERSTFIY